MFGKCNEKQERLVYQILWMSMFVLIELSSGKRAAESIIFVDEYIFVSHYSFNEKKQWALSLCGWVDLSPSSKSKCGELWTSISHLWMTRSSFLIEIKMGKKSGWVYVLWMSRSSFSWNFNGKRSGWLYFSVLVGIPFSPLRFHWEKGVGEHIFNFGWVFSPLKSQWEDPWMSIFLWMSISLFSQCLILFAGRWVDLVFSLNLQWRQCSGWVYLLLVDEHLFFLIGFSMREYDGCMCFLNVDAYMFSLISPWEKQWISIPAWWMNTFFPFQFQ